MSTGNDEYYKSSDGVILICNNVKNPKYEKPKVVTIKNNGKNVILHKQPKKSKCVDDKLSIFKRYDE